MSLPVRHILLIRGVDPCNKLFQQLMSLLLMHLDAKAGIKELLRASQRRLRMCRTGYTRVIVEKPFGKDSESFRQLSADLYQHLTEDQMFRIDHYLGKELIENLTASPKPNLAPQTCATVATWLSCDLARQ